MAKMNENRRRILTRVVAGLIAVLMLLALILSVLPMFFIDAAAAPVSQKNVDEMRDKLADIAKEKEKIEREIESLEKERNSQIKKKLALDRQIAMTQQEIDLADELIQTLLYNIGEREDELAAARDSQHESHEKLKKRMRAMYETNTTSNFLAILLEGNSFSEFLTRNLLYI